MNISKITTGIVETNTYFLTEDSGECIVVDPGDDIKKIADYLNENNLICKYVLLTHAHFDHCNAAYVLQRNGAKILMHKKDCSLIKGDGNLASKFGVLFNKFKPDGYVTDNEDIELLGKKVTVLHTPGHTAGSCCFIVDNFMFSGDTIMRLSRGRTDFPTGSDRAMKKSLKRLAAIMVNYTIFPGHNGATNLDFERKNNPYV